MRMIGVMIGCALILAAVPGWAGTTTINFANGIGPLSYQSGSGRLQASGGRAVFTGVNSTMLASNGSPVAANGTITATMSLNPYPDALNGVGLVMVDTSDLGNMLTAIVDGNTGQVTLMGWMELYTTVDFTYPAALNSMTLQYDVYTDRATLTLNGSQSVFLDEALGGAYSVYVGVGANGPGGFASFSATGNGIPVYPPPPEPPNGITANPSGFIEENTNLQLTAPAGSNFQWKKNGGNLSDSTKRTMSGAPEESNYRWKNASAHLSGATTRTLTIDSVEPGDAGTYTCGYKNSNNVAKLSEPYTLVVYEPGSLPATGVVGTAFLAGLVALSGLAAICLRRGRVAS